jgi:CheY-like chemotaxis protein
VLVAEDHPVNRAYLEAVLDKLGHRRCSPRQRRERSAQRADEPFDIVLMDLHMPGHGRLRRRRDDPRDAAPRGAMPIVALTADAFQASRDLAREAGMDGFLTKPAHLPQLRELLGALRRRGEHHVAPRRVGRAETRRRARPETVDDSRGASAPTVTRDCWRASSTSRADDAPRCAAPRPHARADLRSRRMR